MVNYEVGMRVKVRTISGDERYGFIIEKNARDNGRVSYLVQIEPHYTVTVWVTPTHSDILE